VRWPNALAPVEIISVNPSVSEQEIDYVYAKFVGFVEYCEKAEAKLGEPVPIRVDD